MLMCSQMKAALVLKTHIHTQLWADQIRNI